MFFVRRAKVSEARSLVAKKSRREGKHIVILREGADIAAGNIKWAMKPVYCPLYALDVRHFVSP